MKKAPNWGTWVSLLAVASVSTVIGFRLLPPVPVTEQEVDGKSLLPPRGPGKISHANAESASPIEKMFKGDDQPPHGPADGGPEPARWTYALSSPDRTYHLPPLLDEVSDLSATADSTSLWAVNDELGTLYRIETADGGVAESYDFGPRGDYEALLYTDGGAIVGSSDGLLYFVGFQDAGTRIVDSTLGPTCNLEGMAFEPARRKLLLLCKSELPKQPKDRRGFGIYGMTLETKTLIREPLIVLLRQSIDDYVGTHANDPSLKRTMGSEFAPSAIAVHPKTGQLYLLSARGAMLVVLEPNGALVRVTGLNPIMHPQPEGIAFDAEGTMYISNESRGAHALLYSYRSREAKP